MQRVELPKQTLGEEIANSISHGIGAALSVFGTVILILISVVQNSIAGILCAAFYGGSLIVLYLSSTLYHSISSKKAKKVFRVLDHCTIFLLISGTYAPISILTIGGKTGYLLITVNSLSAIVGIILNAIDMKKYKIISMILYIVMGWMCIFTLKPLIEAASLEGFLVLLLGGIFYTVGLVFYKSKQKFMHFIWHIFVVMGSVLQYFFILNTCYLNIA